MNFLPRGVLYAYPMPTMTPVRLRTNQRKLPTKNLETPMTKRVSAGSSSFDPKSLNMFSKPGMTNVSRIVSTPRKTTMTMLG